VRLDRAAELLVTTERAVKEVWSDVGYNDGSNFTHDFVERFNVTPKGYRARRVEITQAPLARPIEPALSIAPPLARSVLVVDDDEGTRETLARALRGVGYRVRVAGTGAQALREVDRPPVAAVVLDFHLPDMSGLECLREMRQTPPGSRVAVAIFTADWNVEDQHGEIHALGAVIQSKLCDLDQVICLVASLCAAQDALRR
jgi:CheY-like chemotaxis protein